jgi:Zn-dependent oligopeptidase
LSNEFEDEVGNESEKGQLSESTSNVYKDNYMFTRFEHLFDYEGQYHSYLTAEILARDLYIN